MDRSNLKVTTLFPAKAAVNAKLVATEGMLTAEAVEIKEPQSHGRGSKALRGKWYEGMMLLRPLFTRGYELWRPCLPISVQKHI